MRYAKESLKNQIPYHSKNITEGIILNANESPFPPKKELLNYLSDVVKTASFNRYPDTDCLKLREAIAKFYQVGVDNVCCGVGSDQLLDSLFRSTISNEYVLICNPSFSMYSEYAKLSNAKAIYAPFNEDLTYNVDYILDSIKKYDPKITFICTPNNPTGATIKRADLLKIINATDNIVVIDEAYAEFADESFIDLAKEYANVIIFRTFSKAYGLAGMRVGYAISSKDNIDLINLTKAPYNLSTFTQEAAWFVINNTDLYENDIANLKKYRDELYLELQKLNIEVYPSEANFLFMYFDEKVYNHLLEKLIYVRVIKFNNKAYYRVNIGTAEENVELLKAIKEAL